MLEENTDSSDLKLCGCGCNLPVKPNYRGKYAKFIRGHSSKLRIKPDKYDLIPCECGCGEMITKFTNNNMPRKFKYGHSNRGKFNPRYHGKRKHSDGYTILYKPYHRYAQKSNGCVYNHRVVKEIYLSILNGIPTYIHPSLDIHHKDNNPTNNDPKNLLVVSHSDHASISGKERIRIRQQRHNQSIL